MAREAADNPTILEVYKALQDDTMRRVLAWEPANVLAYAPAPVPRVTVQLARQIETSGAGTLITPGPIPDVPVAFPSFGGWAFWGDLLPGDEVLLGIPSRSVAGWLKKGAIGPPDPDDRRFSLADAVAWPVRMSTARASGLAAGAGQVRLAKLDGTASLAFDAAGQTATLDAVTNVLLGIGAVSPVAKQPELITMLLGMLAAGAGATVPGDGGTAAIAAMIAYLGIPANTAPVAALKAKAL